MFQETDQIPASALINAAIEAQDFIAALWDEVGTGGRP